MKQQLVALITGSNRGIGTEIARQLAQRKVKVYLGIRTERAGLETQEKLRHQGLDAVWLPMDVNDPTSIRQAGKAFRKLESRLDILINNAAILEDHANIVQMDPELFHKTLKTNCFGPILVTQEFADLLPQGGRIINMSSSMGALNGMQSYSPAYSLSKTLLNGITLQFAGALSGKGVSVNSVCPGWVRSDMGGSAAPRTLAQGAATAVWLALEAPSSLTGKFLRDKEEIPW